MNYDEEDVLKLAKIISPLWFDDNIIVDDSNMSGEICASNYPGQTKKMQYHYMNIARKYLIEFCRKNNI